MDCACVQRCGYNTKKRTPKHKMDQSIFVINDIPNILSDDIDRNRAKEEILTSPIYKDLVISSDARTTAMQLVIKKNQSLFNALKQRNLFFEKYQEDESFENEYELAKARYQNLAEKEKQKTKLLIEEILSLLIFA